MAASDAPSRSMSGSELVPLLSLDDVAGVLGVSRRTIERMVTRGEIPIVRVGPRAIRVRAEDVQEFIRRGLIPGT